MRKSSSSVIGARDGGDFVGETSSSVEPGATNVMMHHHRRASSTSSAAVGSSSTSTVASWLRRPSVFFIACVATVWMLAHATHEERSVFCSKPPKHVVFVDAGSTGCRAHAFEIDYIDSGGSGSSGSGSSLFHVRTLGSKVKTKLPLADMGGRVKEELLPALREAQAYIGDARDRDSAAVYVWATAGFRVLTPVKQQALWDEVRAVVSAETTLRHGHGHFKTIDGEDEGFFAWLAANYLSDVDVTAVGRARDSAGAFSRISDSEHPLASSVGAIDVGGGSVQYVALPAHGGVNAKSMRELRDAVKVQSFLGFGANHMETRWRGELASRGEKSNPCAFPGYAVKVDGVELVGTGAYDECVAGLRRQIASMQREQGIDLAMPDHFRHVDKFLGMSLLYHITNFITVALPGSLSEMPKATLGEIAKAGKRLCAVEWTTLLRDVDGKDPNTPTDRLNGRCFDAALTQALLGSSDDGVGFGFSQKDQRVRFVERVAGAEVEWTLGAAMSVVHPAASQLNPKWIKTRAPSECSRVLHDSFVDALYGWSTLIMPAAIVTTAYLLRKSIQAARPTGTMAKSPSLLDII